MVHGEDKKQMLYLLHMCQKHQEPSQSTPKKHGQKQIMLKTQNTKYTRTHLQAYTKRCFDEQKIELKRHMAMKNLKNKKSKAKHLSFKYQHYLSIKKDKPQEKKMIKSLLIGHKLMYYKYTLCRSGGIGRRARLKIW